MDNRPLYKKLFSRDFTLINMEIWWRGEVFNDKIWVQKHQPFLPYIVFEKTSEAVGCFYDPRGVEWIKNLLLEKVNQDSNFLSQIKKNLLENLTKMRNTFNKKTELSNTEFLEYISVYENGYVWLEAAWWLWDMTEKELRGAIIPDSFKRLRKNTEDYVPKSETLIRKSLAKMYPEFKEFIDVIRISEIQDNKIPNIEELLKRKRGYYFTDNKLFTGLSRKDIERKYNIKFETVETGNVQELVGESVYRGKVSGKVKIVLSIKKLNKIENGDVLVSGMTLPDFLPAIQKAAAIVTDEGGLLCHAAIIARELKKPCIIGTKVATQVLHDGDLVEVDAERGIVKIIQKADVTQY